MKKYIFLLLFFSFFLFGHDPQDDKYTLKRAWTNQNLMTWSSPTFLGLNLTNDLTSNNLTATPTLGTELITFSGAMGSGINFTWDASWTWSTPPATFTRTAGMSATSFATVGTAIIGTCYKVVITSTDAGVGDLRPTFGGQTFSDITTSGTTTFYCLATAPDVLALTPTNIGFSGTITGISIKVCTNGIVSGLTGDFTSLTSTKINYSVADWTAGNITYVPLTGDIQTYITQATAGDTLILGSGTYTIIDTITVPKQLNIVGQGNAGTVTTPPAISHGTVIACATNNKSIFNITGSNVKISDLSISATGSNCYGILSAANLTGLAFSKIDVVLSGNGFQQAFSISGSNSVLRDLTFYVESLDSYSVGVLYSNVAGITNNYILDCHNVTGTTIGATGSFGFLCRNTNVDYTVTMNLINCYCKAVTSAGVDTAVQCDSSGGFSKAIINSFLCTFDGADFDALQNNSNVLALGGSVLVNDKISGTVTYRATLASGNIVTPIAKGIIGIGADQAGGLFSLQGGQGTGTGIPAGVKIQTSYNGFASNSTAQTIYSRDWKVGKVWSITDAAAAAPIITITCPAAGFVNGKIIYSIEAIDHDGAEMQCESGEVTFAALQHASGSTYHIASPTEVSTQALSTGSMTTAWTMTSGSNVVLLNLAVDSDMDFTTAPATGHIYLRIQIILNSPQTITLN